MDQAKVIVLANIKGGPGKTTLAIHLADYLSTVGRVLLVDSDPQESLVKWNRASEGELRVPVFSNTETHVHREISKVSPDYDYIIVDTPPSALAMSDITKSALLVANLAIIPVTPSVLDVWEAIGILDLIQELNQTREFHGIQEMDYRIVLNKVKSRTSMARDIEDLLLQKQISRFSTQIAEREAYKQSAAAGLTVFQMGNTVPVRKARAEITTLGQEVQEVLNGQEEFAQEQI